MNRQRMSDSRTVEKIRDAIQHIEYIVSSFGDTHEIAWNFIVGQAILDKAKEQGISINMEARIDLAKGEPRIYIGEALVELKAIEGGGNSPENQQNSEIET
jgi:hypothetical protein